MVWNMVNIPNKNNNKNQNIIKIRELQIPKLKYPTSSENGEIK